MDYEQIYAEICALKSLIADTNDYAIEVGEGAATKEDYSEILANRKAWRSRIKELERILDNV